MILIGHSMGGLCAREYIQNESLWINNNHHVAKLITSGTPHGGSVFGQSTLGELGSIAVNAAIAIYNIPVVGGILSFAANTLFGTNIPPQINPLPNLSSDAVRDLKPHLRMA